MLRGCLSDIQGGKPFLRNKQGLDGRDLAGDDTNTLALLDERFARPSITVEELLTNMKLERLNNAWLF